MLRDRTRRSKSKLAPIAALIFAAMTGAALTALPANAGTVPTISCTSDVNVFNTAFDNSPSATGPLLTGPDANWKVTSILGAPGNGLADITNPYTDAVVVDAPPTPWFTPSAKAGWISHQFDGDQSATYDHANADFFYKFDFALDAAVDAPSFALNMSFYADNSVSEIYVNGVAQSATIPSLPTGGLDPYMYEGYKQDTATSVVLGKDWQAGNNSLVVKIQSGWNKEGFGATISGVPTCKPPMEVISAQAICDDEHPKSLLITGTGFDATSTVKIGGLDAVVTSYTDTTLIVTIPKLAKGWVDVSVTKGEFVLTLTNGFLVGCECAEEEHHSEDGDNEGDHHDESGEGHHDGDHHDESGEGDHHGDNRDDQGHHSGEHKPSEPKSGDHKSGEHKPEGGVTVAKAASKPMTFHITEPTEEPSSTPSASPSEGNDDGDHHEDGDHDGSEDGDHHDGDHAEEPLCAIVTAPVPAPTVLDWTVAGPGVQQVAPAANPTVASEPVVETPAAVEPTPEASSPEATETPAPESATETPATETPAAETPAAETPAEEAPVVSPDAVERQSLGPVAYSVVAVSAVAPKAKAAKAKSAKIKSAKAKAAKIKAAKAKIKALKLSKKH